MISNSNILILACSDQRVGTGLFCSGVVNFILYALSIYILIENLTEPRLVGARLVAGTSEGTKIFTCNTTS